MDKRDKQLLIEVFKFVYASATQDEAALMKRMDEFATRAIGVDVRGQYLRGIRAKAGPTGRLLADGTWVNDDWPPPRPVTKGD